MDPGQLSILANALAPVLGALVCLGMPVAIVFTVKHFKLRHRELELEAELHGRRTQARLDSIEARLGVIESALGVIARNPGMIEEHRRAMLESPAGSQDIPTASPSQPVRTR